MSSDLSNESSSSVAKIPFAKLTFKDEPSPWIDWSAEGGCTLVHVLTIKRHLLRTFPIEIVDIIISFAEYWPHVSDLTRGLQNFKGEQRHICPLPIPTSPPNHRNQIWPLLGKLESGYPEIYNEDTLLVQSAPLGLSHQTSHPLLLPKRQYPARKVAVEVKVRRVIPAQKVYERLGLFQISHTWLEIGVVDQAAPNPRPQYRCPPPLITGEEQNARRNVPESSLHKMLKKTAQDSQFFCAGAYCAWEMQRMSLTQGSLKINLFLDDYPEGESVTVVRVYLSNEDNTEPCPNDPLTANWSLMPDYRKETYIKAFDFYDAKDRLEGTEFVRRLQVGDQVGVWSMGLGHGTVNGIENVAMIEGVRVTVSWEV